MKPRLDLTDNHQDSEHEASAVCHASNAKDTAATIAAPSRRKSPDRGEDPDPTRAPPAAPRYPGRAGRERHIPALDERRRSARRFQPLAEFFGNALMSRTSTQDSLLLASARPSS
jgi:hypothetical protein